MKWSSNYLRTLRLGQADIRWKEAKWTQTIPRELHMWKVLQPKLLKAFACTIDTGLFYGDREFRDGYYDFDNQSVFTINAMDGTVIDREYVY